MTTKDIERVREIQKQTITLSRDRKRVDYDFDIKQLMELARLAFRLADEVERLENLLFEMGAMGKAPCFCCGYNGPGYYQPKKHPCAKKHHSPPNKRGKRDG